MADFKCGAKGQLDPKCKLSDFPSCDDLGVDAELNQLVYKYNDLDALNEGSYEPNHKVGLNVVNKKADQRFWQTNPFASQICTLPNKKNPKKTDFYVARLPEEVEESAVSNSYAKPSQEKGFLKTVEDYYEGKAKAAFNDGGVSAEKIFDNFWQEIAAVGGLLFLIVTTKIIRSASKKKKKSQAEEKATKVEKRVQQPPRKAEPLPTLAEQRFADEAPVDLVTRTPTSLRKELPKVEAKPEAAALPQVVEQAEVSPPPQAVSGMQPFPKGAEVARESGEHGPHQTIHPEAPPDMQKTVEQQLNGLSSKDRPTMMFGEGSTDEDDGRTDREPPVDILLLLKKFDPPVKSLKKDSDLHKIEEKFGKKIPESVVKRAMVLVNSEFNPQISTPKEVLELVLEAAAKRSKNGKVSVVNMNAAVLDFLILKDLFGGEGGMLDIIDEVQEIEAETGKHMPIEVVWKAKLLVREYFHPQGMTENEALVLLLRESSEQCKWETVTKGNVIDTAALFFGNEDNAAAEEAMKKAEIKMAGQKEAFNQRIEKVVGGYQNWIMRDGYEPAQGAKGPAVDAKVRGTMTPSASLSDQMDRASNVVTIKPDPNVNYFSDTPHPINVHELMEDISPFKTLPYFKEARMLMEIYVRKNTHFAGGWLRSQAKLDMIKIAFTTVLGEVEEEVAKTYLNFADGVTEAGYEASTQKAEAITRGSAQPYYIPGLDPVAPLAKFGGKGSEAHTAVIGQVPQEVLDAARGSRVHKYKIPSFQTVEYYKVARDAIGDFVEENSFARKWSTTQEALAEIRLAFTTVLSEVQETVAKTLFNEEGATQKGYEASTQKALAITRGSAQPYYVPGLDPGAPLPKFEKKLPDGLTEDHVRVMVQKTIDLNPEISRVLNAYEKQDVKENVIWAMKEVDGFYEVFEEQIQNGQIPVDALETALSLAQKERPSYGNMKPKAVAKAEEATAKPKAEDVVEAKDGGSKEFRLFTPEEEAEMFKGFGPMKGGGKK